MDTIHCPPSCIHDEALNSHHELSKFRNIRFFIRMSGSICHRVDIMKMTLFTRMRYHLELSHPGDLRWYGMSSGWHSALVISYPDEMPPGATSSWWLMVASYVIRRIYCNVHKSSRSLLPKSSRIIKMSSYVIRLRCHRLSTGWLISMWYIIRLRQYATLRHPYDLAPSISLSRRLMANAICHRNDTWSNPTLSSAWNDEIWALSHPNGQAPGSISFGLPLAHAVWHSNDIRWYPKSYGWHIEIRVSHPDDLLKVISHLDELRQIHYLIQLAVALQLYCAILYWPYGKFTSNYDISALSHDKNEKKIYVCVSLIWFS